MKSVDLSDLLACLYRAPLDATGWQHFVDCLSRLTGAAGGAFLHHDMEQGVFEVRALGGVSADPGAQREYNLYYGALDPWREPFMARGLQSVTPGTDVVPQPELERTEFFNDFLMRYGITDLTMMPACVDRNRIENVSLWRGPGQGAMSPELLRLLRLLQPHLCTAVETEHRLSAARREAAGFEAMLDAMHDPVLLLDQDLRLRHANLAAEQLLSSGAIWRVGSRHDGRLRVSPFRQPAFDAMLRRAVMQAEADAAQIERGSGDGAGGSEMLPLERTGRRPLHAAALPLRLEQEVPPAHALLLLTDPDARVAAPLEALRTLYGVTPTEAIIANGLLEGLTLAEIAERRRLREDTARSHLKTLFRRTGTNRQTELVLLLGSLPRAHRG